MALLTRPDAWLAFVTLTVLELVLGIDNVIFIAILVDKLPVERREITRRIGLLVAMVMRVALLFLISWIVGLTAPLFTVFGNEISGRDLILIGGGLGGTRDEFSIFREREFGCMHADDVQTERAITLVPLDKIRKRAQTIQATEIPKVHEHDCPRNFSSDNGSELSHAPSCNSGARMKKGSSIYFSRQ